MPSVKVLATKRLTAKHNGDQRVFKNVNGKTGGTHYTESLIHPFVSIDSHETVMKVCYSILVADLADMFCSCL